MKKGGNNNNKKNNINKKTIKIITMFNILNDILLYALQSCERKLTITSFNNNNNNNKCSSIGNSVVGHIGISLLIKLLSLEPLLLTKTKISLLSRLLTISLENNEIVKNNINVKNNDRNHNNDIREDPLFNIGSLMLSSIPITNNNNNHGITKQIIPLKLIQNKPIFLFNKIMNTYIKLRQINDLLFCFFNILNHKSKNNRNTVTFCCENKRTLIVSSGILYLNEAQLLFKNAFKSLPPGQIENIWKQLETAFTKRITDTYSDVISADENINEIQTINKFSLLALSDIFIKYARNIAITNYNASSINKLATLMCNKPLNSIFNNIRNNNYSHINCYITKIPSIQLLHTMIDVRHLCTIREGSYGNIRKLPLNGGDNNNENNNNNNNNNNIFNQYICCFIPFSGVYNSDNINDLNMNFMEFIHLFNSKDTKYRNSFGLKHSLNINLLKLAVQRLTFLKSVKLRVPLSHDKNEIKKKKKKYKNIKQEITDIIMFTISFICSSNNDNNNDEALEISNILLNHLSIICTFAKKEQLLILGEHIVKYIKNNIMNNITDHQNNNKIVNILKRTSFYEIQELRKPIFTGIIKAIGNCICSVGKNIFEHKNNNNTNKKKKQKKVNNNNDDDNNNNRILLELINLIFQNNTDIGINIKKLLKNSLFNSRYMNNANNNNTINNTINNSKDIQFNSLNNILSLLQMFNSLPLEYFLLKNIKYYKYFVIGVDIILFNVFLKSINDDNNNLEWNNILLASIVACRRAYVNIAVYFNKNDNDAVDEDNNTKNNLLWFVNSTIVIIKNSNSFELNNNNNEKKFNLNELISSVINLTLECIGLSTELSILLNIPKKDNDGDGDGDGSDIDTLDDDYMNKNDWYFNTQPIKSRLCFEKIKASLYSNSNNIDNKNDNIYQIYDVIEEISSDLNLNQIMATEDTDSINKNIKKRKRGDDMNNSNSINPQLFILNIYSKFISSIINVIENADLSCHPYVNVKKAMDHKF